MVKYSKNYKHSGCLTFYGLIKLGLELKCGLRLGLIILQQTTNSYPIIKYKGIFVFIFNSFAHIKSDCNFLQHAPTCSLLFLDSFNRYNVIFYKQIHLKLLHAFILFIGFILYCFFRSVITRHSSFQLEKIEMARLLRHFCSSTFKKYFLCALCRTLFP